LVSGGEYEAATLPGGRVLIVGSTEAIYDPSTDELTELDVPGTLLPAVTLADGRVLLMAELPSSLVGIDGPTTLMTFDPATGVFDGIGPATFPDRRATWVRLPDGRVLAIPSDIDASGSRQAWVLR
jgi:hypothetical protein